jgi:hypothetical protein
LPHILYSRAPTLPALYHRGTPIFPPFYPTADQLPVLPPFCSKIAPLCHRFPIIFRLLPVFLRLFYASACNAYTAAAPIDRPLRRTIKKTIKTISFLPF